MAVARIRTSDPEVVEFLSRHLASSGYQLEFVRPGEPVQGDAELEIDASRMDLESAIAAARQEGGLITVLSGVLKADAKRDIFEEAAQTTGKHEYAEVSPYARGAELEDEPSALHKTVDSMARAFSIGVNSVGQATKSANTRFIAWRTQRAEEQRLRREQRERELAVEAAQRRKEEARRVEEEARRRAEEERRKAEEERVAAIRRDEQAKAEADARRRREEQERVEAAAARQRAEEARRLEAEAAQRRAEEQRVFQEQARLRALEEERRRAEEVAATGIERQRLEEMHAVEPQAETSPANGEQELPQIVDASQERLIAESEAASIPDSVSEPEWQPAEPPAPKSEPIPVVVTPTPDRRHAVRRLPGEREKTFKRAAVAAAIVAAFIVGLWSLAAIRRPANPLNREQLERSAAVEQQRPFGPAQTVAPVMRPALAPAARPATPVRRSPAVKPSPRSRTSRTRSSSSQVAHKNSSEEDRNSVVVRHFATQKQEQAKVKTKNGVKIISESE